MWQHISGEVVEYISQPLLRFIASLLNIAVKELLKSVHIWAIINARG